MHAIYGNTRKVSNKKFSPEFFFSMKEWGKGMEKISFDTKHEVIKPDCRAFLQENLYDFCLHFSKKSSV